jgi:hypothetical protein
MLSRALVLVPHPDLPVVLRTWLDDDDPLVRALAIDVLGYRRLATEDELGAALRSESRDVVAAAMPWAALSRSPELRAAVDGHRGTDHETLAAAVAWAPALSGARDATDRLAAMLGTEREAYALFRSRSQPTPTTPPSSSNWWKRADRGPHRGASAGLARMTRSAPRRAARRREGEGR